MNNPNTPKAAKYFFIASKLKVKDKNFLVFDVQSSNPNPGAPIDAYELKNTSNDNQLWQWSADSADSPDSGRFLVSKMNGFVVDVLNAGTDTGTPLDAFPIKTANMDNQLWTFSANGHLVSKLNNMVIEIPADANLTSGPVLQMNTLGTGDNQKWSMIPDYPLEDILRMKDKGYSKFTAGQESAFEAINAQLGVKNIRTEYTNMNKAISKALLVGLQRPENVNLDDWDIVSGQLAKEFQAVADVRELFKNFLDFYTELTVDQQARLNQAAIDANMDIGTVVSYPWVGLIEAIVVALVSLITVEVGLGLTVGVVASAAASIISGIVNVVLGKEQIGGDDLTFEGELSSLWAQLSGNFETVLIAISQQQNNILENWDKLQALEARINADGPTALAWNSVANARFVQAGGVAYTIFTLQQLLPTRFQIRRWSQIGGSVGAKGFPPNAPSAATWTVAVANNQLVADSYTIQDSDGLFPGTQALDDLWNNGVQQADFFNARNGWEKFQVIEQAIGFSSLAINFVNQSGNSVVIGVKPDVSTTSFRGVELRTLNPYWNLQSILDTIVSGGTEFMLQASYEVEDLSTNTIVISFRATMSKSGEVTVDMESNPQNYAFEISALVNADESSNTGGGFTVTMWEQ